MSQPQPQPQPHQPQTVSSRNSALKLTSKLHIPSISSSSSSSSSLTGSSSNKKYSLVIYGATGYLGSICCRYYATTIDPSKWKMAIAGRDHGKLASVRKKMSQIHPGYESIDMLTASTENETSLKRMCESTYILLNCVGPYRFHGEPVVASCIDYGCHYIDMCNELTFIRNMINKYSRLAKKKKVLIISSCGFQSVIDDLGCMLAETYFPPSGAIEAYGYFDSTAHPFGQMSRGNYTALVYSVAARTTDKKIFQISELSEEHNKNSKSQSKGSLNSPKIRYYSPNKSWYIPFISCTPWVVRKSRSLIRSHRNSLGQRKFDPLFNIDSTPRSSSKANGRTSSRNFSISPSPGSFVSEAFQEWFPNDNFQYSHYYHAGSFFRMIFIYVLFWVFYFICQFQLGRKILTTIKNPGPTDSQRAGTSVRHTVVVTGYSQSPTTTDGTPKLKPPSKVDRKVTVVASSSDMFTATGFLGIQAAMYILKHGVNGSIIPNGVFTPGASLGLPYFRNCINANSPSLMISVGQENL